MAIKQVVVAKGQRPTKEQLLEVERASKMPIVYDEDSPKLTEAQLAQFHRINEEEKEARTRYRKQNVTIRLSPQAIKKAKSFGKGYTSVLSNIIEKALNNPTIIEELYHHS